MGLRTELLRRRVEDSRRARVSEIVLGGKVERSAIRDSIAAMGRVRAGSVCRRWL